MTSLLLSNDSLSIASRALTGPGWDRCDICKNDPCTCHDFSVENLDGTTVKQEALSLEQWIRWSHCLPLDITPIGTTEGQMLRAVHGDTCGCGQDDCYLCSKSISTVAQTWDKCPCEDQPDNYQCPWCS